MIRSKISLFAVLLAATAFVGCSSKTTAGKDSAVQTSKNPEQVDVTTLNVDKYFPNNDGTFILRDLNNNKTFVFNQQRATTRQSPESTFKVAHALIGLQVGAVKDEFDVKRWDGVQREVPAWNRDQTLASAMRFSAVWYYQAMARDIGPQREQEWLTKMNYGNKDISAGIDHFWLNSSLKISPMEEVDFITNLYEEKLPFDKQVMKTVKRMMILDDQDTYTLYGKTGTRNTPPVGWFVGYVKTKDDTYVFATNVDGQGTTSSIKAKQVTYSILKDNKIINAQ